MIRPPIAPVLEALRVTLAVGIVFGGMWLGNYMMADRPLPTVLAAAPATQPVAGAGQTGQLAPGA
jgi:hypothetical protein